MDKIYLGIPCSGCEHESIIPCTREDEAIAIAVGMKLAGIDDVEVFMQNSGWGNCLDIITSLLEAYAIGLLIAVFKGSTTPQHKLMNEIYKDILTNYFVVMP